MEVPDISHLSSNAKRMQTAEAMGWLTCDTALAKSVKLYEVIEAEFVLLATCVSDVEKMCSEFKSISVQITELFHQLVIKRDNQHPHPDFVCATFSWPPLLEELDRMSCRLDNDLKLRSWLVFQLSGYYPTRTRSVNSSNDLISSPKTSSYAVKLHQLSMFSRHLNNLLSWDLLSAMTDNLLHSLDSAP
ncbi:unnamed protein product [Protopolystoma xenopodis]|uniref:Uncharacterized protein n=1 Tax=Protopolystoma xenopodis TaxID=117903 RepID=A0A448WD14_9PLAT|nr:unnamed protein product [Protopolystoma xenopodis]